jgi:flagellar protein FliO/FliZ
MDYTLYLRFLLALGIVILLIGGAAWLLKRLQKRFGLRLHGGQRRLELLEILPIDTKRRLLLIRRDDREHLLLIGGEQDLVVERDISTDRSFSAMVSGALAADAPSGPNRVNALP